MPNLKEVRNRIVSVNSTMQITSAMKMVAAAKMKKAQDAIIQMRPYAEKMTEILSNLSGSLDASEGAYSADRDVKRVLLVAISANRGLCGAFNANVIKAVKKEAEETYKNADVHIMCVGKKVHDVIRKSSYKVPSDAAVSEERNDVFDNLNFSYASEVAQEVMDAFVAENYDKVVLVYNSFKNAAVQIMKTEQFLPIVPAESNEETSTDVEYIFEPGKKEILDEIIPKSLKTQFYKAVLDSNASEQGARMTAMHKATDNASELLKNLKLSYNKARQAAITTEILEITSGAEALNG